MWFPVLLVVSAAIALTWKHGASSRVSLAERALAFLRNKVVTDRRYQIVIARASGAFDAGATSDDFAFVNQIVSQAPMIPAGESWFIVDVPSHTIVSQRSA